MQKSSPIPPLPLRRSHLDSATYRTLVRILSHCVDESLSSAPIHPSPSEPDPRSVGTQSQEQGLSSTEKDRISVGNSSEVVSDKFGSEGHSRGASGELRKDLVYKNPNIDDSHRGTLGCSLDETGNGNEREGQCEVSNNERLTNIDQNFRLEEELGHVNIQEGLGEHVNSELPKGLVSEIRQDGCAQDVLQKELDCGIPDLFDYGDGFSNLIGELEKGEREEELDVCVSNGFQNDPMLEDDKVLDSQKMSPLVEELGPGEKCQERCDEFINSELQKERSLDAQSEVFCTVEESGSEMQHENRDLFGSTAVVSRLRNLGEDQVTYPVGLTDDREMEEGEIPNEEGVSDLSCDLELDHADTEERQLEERMQSGDSAEKGNTHYTQGTFTCKGGCNDGYIKEGMINSTGHESNEPVNAKIDEFNHTSVDDKMLKPQKKKKDGDKTKKDTKSANVIPDNLSLLGGITDDVAVQSGEQPSNVKDAKVRERTKRGPLTEKAKAKKKLAKKRKRAETNKKLGIKRLKLNPISKPKKVIYCNFYLKGRCKQGDLCKFSHDTTPLTKSQPCRFFACQTCLKGDDCPFDHQLSKYPCHNYMSKGTCSRGDMCMFSHKMPIVEGSSTMSIISKPDSPMSSEKQSLPKRLTANNSSSPVVNNLPESKTLSTQPSMHKDSMEHLVEVKPKPPTMVPKGICFLSFGKEPSDGTDKRQRNLSLKKGDGVRMKNQQNRIDLDKPQNSNEILFRSLGASGTLKSLVNGHSTSLSLAQKPTFSVQYKHNIKSSEVVQSRVLGKESKSGSLSSGLAALPSSESLESGVTHATKILEDFLFGGGI